ncbi:MAG: hypothetical protein AB7V46_21745 [Thermomicrobiales bacterium]
MAKGEYFYEVVPTKLAMLDEKVNYYWPARKDEGPAGCCGEELFAALRMRRLLRQEVLRRAQDDGGPGIWRRESEAEY